MIEKRILVITYWPFHDALIQTYTLPYLKIISQNPSTKIWLICLQPVNKKIAKAEHDSIQGQLAPYRISLVLLDYKSLSLAGVLNTVKILFQIFRLAIKIKASFIHAWGTPAGALGYIVARILSKPLIIDSYEPHAEAMVENGTWEQNSFAFRVLFWLEKKQSHYASKVIAAAAGMREYALHKYGKQFTGNFFVKPACVDFGLFDYRKKNSALKKSLQLEGKIVALYAGKFGGIYLDKDFFQWVRVAWHHWGEKFRLLLLTSHSEQEIERYCNEFGIPKSVVVQKFVPHREVPEYMGLADFAVTPVKPVPSKRCCSPIKDGEYWAMGLPVIITKDISDDSEIINRKSIGYVLQSLNDIEYLLSLREMEKLTSDINSPDRIVDVAREYRSFEIAKVVYQHVYPI